MKIVHVCHNYIDGQTYQDNELPEAHARLGHDVTVISTLDFAGSVDFYVNHSIDNHIYTLGSCKIVRLPLCYRSNYRFVVYKGLYKVLEKEKPDLIYFHGMPYFCYYDIVRYKKQHNCKLAVDFHCDHYNSSHRFISKWLLHKILYRTIIRLTRCYVDQYYGVTPGTINFVQEMYGLPQGCVKLLPLGGNLCTIKAASISLETTNEIATTEKKESMRTVLGLPLHAKLIVTAGKIDEGKKTVELIEACKKLKTIDFRLIILGPVDKKYRQKIVEVAGNDTRILLLGWQEPVDIYRYFIAADLACFPGSQSVIWQQAICCGLPLICHYWPGGEYLDSGGNVCFIPEPSVARLQTLLNELLTHESKLEAMTIISRTIGRERFSYDQIARSILNDLYDAHHSPNKYCG